MPPKASLSHRIASWRRRAKPNQLPGESAAEPVKAGEAAEQVTAGECLQLASVTIVLDSEWINLVAQSKQNSEV